MGFFSGIRRRVRKLIPKEVRPFVPYAAALIPGLQGIGGLSAAKSKFLTSAITRGLIDEEADLKDMATAGIMASAPTALEGYVQGLPGDSKTLEFLQKGKEGERITDYISRYANPSGVKDVATVVGGAAAVDAGMQAAEAADDAEKEEDRKSKEFKAKRRQEIKDVFLSNGYSEEETEDMLVRYGYARGGDVDNDDVIMEMEEEVITPFDLKQEEGVPIGPMAGPDWYIKRIENLEFLGYDYEEAAEIAFDSDKYYEIIGMEEPMSKKDSDMGIKRMASNPSPEAERNDAAMSVFGKPLNMLSLDELDQLDEYVRSMMSKGGKVMNKASMQGFGKKYEEWLKKNKPELFAKKEEKNKTEKKASGGRIGFDKGGISDAAAPLIVQLMQTGMSYEEAIELAKQEFPDTSAKDRKLDKEERLEEYMRKKQDEEEDAVSGSLGIAQGGLEQAFGRPFGNIQPTPMLRFSEGGDVEMMDEEFVGDDELRMEEGVQIGPMAEDGETDVEVLMAMKVSPGLIDEYRNYVFELKELDMEHQIAPFRDWFNTTYGAARAGVKKGGKIIKIMPEGVIYKGKAKDYPGIKQLIKDMKKKGTRNKKAEGGLMNLGGNEMDLRGGGFVPMGAKERADDVPARLSKNEFVFTADAVRAAGGGSVNKGADLMYDTMKKLEAQS
ncbi:hypothetical protein [uncultured virus]|uniref:Uncharacterized protein n=1 Tax=uncultured virus TaxID=340016 RepID=A0A218MKN1_9VIRU|nr:hypothetical protein [uncultured virus]